MGPCLSLLHSLYGGDTSRSHDGIEVAEYGDGNESIARKPDVDCNGYPPALLPPKMRERDINFFLSKPRDGQELACSFCPFDMENHEFPVATTIGGVDLAMDTSKPVIIICHGFLSWRNQMLLAHLVHGVAQKLECHSLRFDFAGNGHSSGQLRTGNFDGEFFDLQRIIRFVQHDVKCKVMCVIGHSKGVNAILRVAMEQGKNAANGKEPLLDEYIPCFVNLSGRFYVPGEYKVGDRYSAEKVEQLKDDGVTVVAHQGGRKCLMTAHDVFEREQLDSSMVVTTINAAVLTIHGSADDIIPTVNADRFDEKIHCHEKFIVNGADHNFNGLRHNNTLVARVSEFLQKHRRN